MVLHLSTCPRQPCMHARWLSSSPQDTSHCAFKDQACPPAKLIPMSTTAGQCRSSIVHAGIRRNSNLLLAYFSPWKPPNNSTIPVMINQQHGCPWQMLHSEGLHNIADLFQKADAKVASVPKDSLTCSGEQTLCSTALRYCSSPTASLSAAAASQIWALASGSVHAG